MTAEGRWARIEALFDGAMERPREEREAWLLAHCPDDESIRAEVRGMLAAESRPGLLDRPHPAERRRQDATAIPRRLDAALAGRYAITDTLGEGATALVFLAHERKHDREVVLKVLTPQIAAVLGTERFLTEIRVTARLSHPLILPLLDSGEADGLLYYVMPRVRGISLRERLEQGPLPVAEAIGVLSDIANALAHAHAAGVVHRDLKPENILLGEGHAYLIDFGIAHVEAEARGRNEIVGTHGYMAPEQRLAGEVDPRSDLWAWGRVAVEVLIGQRGGKELLGQRPDLPRAVRSLIERCLRNDPLERPRSAREVVDRLAAVPRGRAGWREWLVAGGIAAAAVLVTALALPGRLTPAEGPIPLPIAVAPFQAEAGDSVAAGWGRLAGAWITQGLQQTGVGQVIPWTVVLETDERFHRERAQRPAAEALAYLRAETGARTVVTGGIYRVAEGLRFTAEISDPRGELRSVIEPVTVSADSGEAGIALLRNRVMGALAVARDDRIAMMPGIVDRPPTYAAYRVFDAGLTRLNALDYAEADSLLRQAWSLDTTFLVPLSYAAIALWNAGEYARLDSLVRFLAPRRDRLSPHYERRLAAHEAMLVSDGGRAYQALADATRLAPSARTGYSVAWYGLDLGKVAEADTILRGIDPDRGLMRDWSPYWTLRTHIDHILEAHTREVASTREFRRRFPATRSAYVVEARALAALGRFRELDSVAVLAESQPSEVYWSYGALLVIAASELRWHRGGREADRYAERALRWLRGRLAVAPGNVAHQYWLGTLLYDLARDDEAEQVFDALVAADPTRLRYRGLRALTEARRNGEAAALRILGAPEPWNLGEHMSYRARIAVIAGDTARGRALLAEALRHRVDNWSWFHTVAQREFPPGSLRADGPVAP